MGWQACEQCDGKNYIDPSTGHNHWVAGPKTNQTYLVLEDATAAGNALDGLLCQGPKPAGRGQSI